MISYRAEIEALHSIRIMTASLTARRGPKIAPRLLGEIGLTAALNPALQCLAGTLRQLPVWKDPQGLSPATLQQAARQAVHLWAT
jgi:hypothetical protein